jgi:hypothetical protein
MLVNDHLLGVVAIGQINFPYTLLRDAPAKKARTNRVRALPEFHQSSTEDYQG